MFGLGYQEVLLLLLIVGIPVVIILAVKRSSRRSGDEGALVGIGGWLVLVAIGVCITPFVLASETIQALRQNDSVTVLVGTLLTIWGVVNAVLFFRRKRHFPKAWIGLGAVTVVLVIIGGLADSGSLKGEAIAPIFWTGVWIIYILRSRRVKATFVR